MKGYKLMVCEVERAPDKDWEEKNLQAWKIVSETGHEYFTFSNSIKEKRGCGTITVADKTGNRNGDVPWIGWPKRDESVDIVRPTHEATKDASPAQEAAGIDDTMSHISKGTTQSEGKSYSMDGARWGCAGHMASRVVSACISAGRIDASDAANATIKMQKSFSMLHIPAVT